MSRALDRAAAYGRIMNARTRSAAVLGIPEVRLSLTLGTVFCMTVFAAAFIVPSAVCYAVPGDMPDYVQVLAVSLCLAALCAEGETTVGNIKHIERGYEDFSKNLCLLNADVRTVTDDEEKR